MNHGHRQLRGHAFTQITKVSDPKCKTGVLSFDQKICCSRFCGKCSDYPTCKSIRGQDSTNTCCKSAIADRKCGKSPANDCVKTCSESYPPCIMDFDVKISKVK